MQKNIKFLLLIFLLFFEIGCQTQDIIDLSELRATEPPTRTPVPTSTKVTPIAASKAKTATPAAHAAGETFDLITQLDKIYERMTGIPEFDLNSDTFEGFNGAVRAAINRINEIAAAGGSDAEKQAAYQRAIEELVDLAKVGQGRTVSVQLSKAGEALKAPAVKKLSKAFKEADAKDISAAIDDFAENVPNLTPEEKAQIATELAHAGAEIEPAASAIQELLPEGILDKDLETVADFSSQVKEIAEALVAGNDADVLEKLIQLKEVVDALGQNLEVAQFLAITIENVERETIAEKDLKSLFSGEGNIRISQVEITMIKTVEEDALSIDMLPKLLAADDFGPMCLLTTDQSVWCLSDGANLVQPPSLEPYSGRLSAMADCNGQILLSTEKELVFYAAESEEATVFAEEGFPFKAPTQLVCDAENRIWALPAHGLADNPWLFKDGEWTNYPTILQNTIGIHGLNIPWGTKFEVNEKSVIRHGKPVDHIPFVTRQTAESWDIFYNVYWESGLWGIVTDQDGEMWFPGSALYHLNFNQRWYGFEGDIGPAYTLLSNGLIMGTNPTTGGVHIFDGSRTWWQLTDWPADFSADVLKTDGGGRVWASGESGIIVWTGESWHYLPPLDAPPLDFIVIGAGPDF